jgi:hypothetical protein
MAPFGDSNMALPRTGLPRSLKSLYDWLASGGAVKEKTAIAALTAITTPDATDLPTALTLINATKAKVNATIAALKS